MSRKLVSFDVRLLAGTTHMTRLHPDEVNRPQGMDGWILNCTVAGSGLIRGEGAPFLSKEGDFLLFPPSVPHLYGHSPETGAWVHHWVYFFPREHWLPWLNWPTNTLAVRQLRMDRKRWQEGMRLFVRLIEIAKSAHPRKLDLSMNRLEELIIFCDMEKSRQAPSPFDERITRVMRRMEGDPSKPLTLSLLAKEAGLSESRLSHIFKENTGKTPMEYLMQIRITRAQELLFISSKTLAEIASDCGFQNQFYFSKVFSHATGMPPGQFRKNALRQDSRKKR